MSREKGYHVSLRLNNGDNNLFLNVDSVLYSLKYIIGLCIASPIL